MTVESHERPSVTDPARPAPRVGMVAYFFPPVGGVAVARTMGSVRYLPDAGWTPVVIAPAGSTYHLTDAAGLGDAAGGSRGRAGAHRRAGHLRRLLAPFRGRGGTTPARRRRCTPRRPRPRPIAATARPSRRRAAAPRANAGLTWPARIRRTLWFPDDQLGWIPSAVMAVRRAHARAPLAALHSSSSPVSAHVAAAIASRRLGIPWVADFRDPWVENPVDPAMGRIDAWRRRTLEAWIIRTADRVTFATPSLHDAYVRRYPERADRFSVIENGYDRAELPPPPARERRRATTSAAWSTRARCTGRPSSPPSSTASRPCSTGGPRWPRACGSSSSAPRPTRARPWRQRGSPGPDVASVVTFTPFLPRAEALRRLADADAALTLLGPGPGMEQFIGAKLYDAIGLDRPVVAMLPPGDAREVLAGLDWGIVCDPEPASVADALERFLDAPPPDRRADPDGRYDRAMLARRLGGLLDELRDASAADRTPA